MKNNTPANESLRENGRVIDQRNQQIDPAGKHRVDACVFRRIRPPIPTTCAHLFWGIRPPVTRCREAACFGYQS